MPGVLHRNARDVAFLLDRQEIHDALLRYCRGIDRCDEELIRSAYHQDSIDSRGDRVANGWEFAQKVVEGMRAQSVRTSHCLTNVLIDIEGDAGYAESYLFSYIWRGAAPNETLTLLAGRYLDTFAQRDGTWAIAHRVLVHDWTIDQIEATPWNDPAVTGMTRGVRGRGDALYQMLPD